MSENYSLGELKDLMQELGVSPKKALGQNFLVSRSAIDKIVAEAKVDGIERWIEIGPGLGALTRPLIEIVDKKSQLQLMELDRKFSEYWRQQGLDVFEGDALRADWGDVCGESSSLLISNLPYQISASLVIDRSVSPHSIQKMILMFQKEVAQRIAASHTDKNYGLISVIAQSFWRIENLIEVGPKDFYPPPKIASRVLVFYKLDKSSSAIADGFEKKYLEFVKSAFSQRRKIVWKNLQPFCASLGLRAEELKEFAVMKGLSESARAEDFSVELYQQLFAKVVEWLSK